MKVILNVCAAIMVALLAACGGGGEGGGDTTTTPPPGGAVTCPNGTQAAAANCPVVAASGAPQVTANGSGVTVSVNGTLSGSAVLWKGAVGGTQVAGTSALSADGKVVTFTPTVRLAYGQQYTLAAVDSIGRTVEIAFTTAAMSCANNAIWSNPAVFSSAYQDCVAPIGVQVLMSTASNTMTDTSCTLVVGSPLSTACKDYAANGTIMFANTGTLVDSQATVWVAYFSAGASVLALLNATTLRVEGVAALPGPLTWVIGNPTGAAIAANVGGVTKRYQASWNGSAVTLTCTVNC